MGKYEPLTHYLQNQQREIWDAQFSDVESVLGFSLPRSAHEYPAWWANQEPGHSQTRGWSDAGWETGQVDLAAKKVRFKRRRNPIGRKVVVEGTVKPIEELWEKAGRISGITDRGQLIEAALAALIRYEAVKQFAAIGGSMPDFVAPARERPTW